MTAGFTTLSAAIAMLAGCDTSLNTPLPPYGGSDAAPYDASVVVDAAAAADAADAAAPVDAASLAACTVHVQPTANDQATVAAALTAAVAGSVVCFDDGLYAFTDQLSVSTRNLTLRGTSSNAVLDFRTENPAALAGVFATASGFTIENLAIENTAGDAVRVEGPVTGITFRGLRITWDVTTIPPDAGSPAKPDGGAEAGADAAAPPKPEAGSDAGVMFRPRYGIYPITCDQVLIEDNDVSGATDSGIYVGQSTHVIVRRNNAHGNPGGIEVENSTNVEVYANRAFDNAGGILVFNTPDLPIENGKLTNVHDNIVDGNNHTNFGLGFVAGLPVGLGILIASASQTEVHDNTITNNNSTGTLIVGCYIFNGFMECSSAVPFNPWPQTNWIHDNIYRANGVSPDPQFAVLVTPGSPVQDILWDGDVDPAHPADPTLRQCITNNKDVGTGGAATFLDFNVRGGFSPLSTDLTPFQCTYPAQSPVTF